MLNKNLGDAKRAKQDEFYTQYLDIQKEIGAYKEHNPDVFRGKVIYCNCDDPYESNFFRYFVLNFEALGLKQLITTSYKPSPVANTQIGLFGSDKTIPQSKGRPKVNANRFIINEVGDLDGDGEFTLEDIAEQLKTNKNNEWMPLKGDGDFRSEESVKLLEQSDIVVTNPPFSLFREYVKQLIDYDKKFVIIGAKNAITYKEVFPLMKDNKMWVGYRPMSGGMLFDVPPKYAEELVATRKEGSGYMIVDGIVKGYVPSIWYTNLDHGRRHEFLELMTEADVMRFSTNKSFQKYDNYDAIEVSEVKNIPSDYDGAMGVPITFFDKHNPDQFEIMGITKAWAGCASKIYPEQIQVNANGQQSNVTKLNDVAALKVDSPPQDNTYYLIDDSVFIASYPRILIKRKKK